MKVAYIAGPYRASSPSGTLKNIMAAREVALKYWKLGYAVICPHLNTALFDGEAADALWMAGDIEIMLRCDVVVMMSNWQDSEGARCEEQYALEHGKTLIYD